MDDSQASHEQQSGICSNIVCGDPEQMANIILLVSPCRSGTTVLLRVFSAAGIESHYQPLKNVLRWKLEAKQVCWRIPSSPGQTIFVKETIGPYTRSESVFNPLASLIEAGLPSENVRLFLYTRTPAQTWLSWRDCWGARASLQNFVQAFKTTSEIERQARDLKIPVLTAVYEALRDHSPAVVVERIFAKLNLNVDRGLIANTVAALPALATTTRGMRFPHEPERFDSWPYLGRAQTTQALEYFKRKDQMPISDEERIRSAGLNDLYDGWRVQCAMDLGLAIRPDPQCVG